MRIFINKGGLIMKIAVLDNIIDTELIYCISPINESHYNYHGFVFTINMFSCNGIDIVLTIDDYEPEKWEKFTKSVSIQEYHKLLNNTDYKKKFPKSYIAINTLRDNLIDLWSNNKETMPRLTF